MSCTLYMKIFPVRFELTFTAPEAAALSIRPREHAGCHWTTEHTYYTQKCLNDQS